MPHELFIGPDERLIYIDGKVFKIPTDFDFYQFVTDNGIMERTKELAAEYGNKQGQLHIQGETKIVNCGGCEWGFVLVNMETDSETQGCHYEGNTAWISLAVNSDNASFFMMRSDSCTVFDAYRRAVAEAGHLDEYLVKGAEPISCPSLKDIKRENGLVAKAISMYEELRDS